MYHIFLEECTSNEDVEKTSKRRLENIYKMELWFRHQKDVEKTSWKEIKNRTLMQTSKRRRKDALKRYKKVLWCRHQKDVEKVSWNDVKKTYINSFEPHDFYDILWFQPQMILIRFLIFSLKTSINILIHYDS